MNKWYYHYAGVTVASALELPEWAPFATTPTSHKSDVVIRQTEPTTACDTHTLTADDTTLSFTLAKIGHFRICNGQEIVLTPHAEADAAELRLFLLGSAWGALGYQRGWLPLHASVVQVGDGAVAFCAPSSHGKSSLAAWLTQQGCELVSDDLCRLDVTTAQAPRIWRSMPRLKLWQDALTELAWQTPVLCRDFMRMDKYHLAAPEAKRSPRTQYPTVPLRAIYLLAWGDLALEPLYGLNAVRAVIEAATYRPEFITALGQSASYWQQTMALVNHIPVFRLQRPHDWAQMPDVGHLLFDHWCSALTANHTENDGLNIDDMGIAEQARFMGNIDQRQSEAAAYLQYSSGTTGNPKGAMISHGATLRYVNAFAEALALDAADVIVGWPPFHHDLGLVFYLMFPLLTGTPVVNIGPDFWVRSPHTLLRAFHDYRGTVSLLPHFTLAHLLRRFRAADFDGISLSSLRRLVVCAETVYPSTVETFQARFAAYGLHAEALGVTYGMAECVLGTTLTPDGQNRPDRISKRKLLAEGQAVPVSATDPDATRIADCGLPIHDTQVTIVDDDGHPLPDRHVGEIVFHCPFLFDGYYNRPDLTAKAVRNGGLYTGDVGYLAEGHLYVVDRKNDLIIVAGKNLYPESVERVGLTLLGKIGGRAAAFGVRDETVGTELPVLICEVREQIDEAQQLHYRQEIRWRVQQELDVALADVQLVRWGWLMITTSGKVARAATREKYLTAGFQLQSLPLLPPDLLQQSPTAMTAALATFWGELAGGATVAPTTNLFTLGISSLILAETVAKLEQIYGCAIPINQFVREPTIANLIHYLSAAQPATARPVALPTLTLQRQKYARNRWLNRFFNEGLGWRQYEIPYALGLQIQRRWLAQPRVQEQLFRQPLTMVKYMASQVAEHDPQEAILRSLMCNIWSKWRIRQLCQPTTFARSCTVKSNVKTHWPPHHNGRGVIYALTHTPDSFSFPQALHQYGIKPTIIAWGRAAGLEPHQVQTLQVYQAQQTLQQGGAVVIYADATIGSGGIEVDFWGGRRVFRPGMATLAETTGAMILPVFSAFATTGHTTFTVTEPLVAEGNTPERRIESLLYHYADQLRSHWSQLYSNLWWRYLR